MSTLDELLKEYQKWNSLPSSQVDIRKFNKIKELIGEAAATAEVSKKYGSSTLKYVSVPERSEGTPILDLVFELDTGEMVLVEAKFGTSLLGRTNDRRVFLVDPGKLKPENLKPLPLQRQVEQLEVQWTKDRIAEIKKWEPELATKLENIKNQTNFIFWKYGPKSKLQKASLRSFPPRLMTTLKSLGTPPRPAGDPQKIHLENSKGEPLGEKHFPICISRLRKRRPQRTQKW